ncbi:outer membrane beta-barrel protein [Parasphingorhabdus sp. JC815]|uniref:outer membrane protein n=1 Tax=Parasphingorhabdus sp. JC815 TaxID=3232140 RepID=UPI0034587921
MKKCVLVLAAIAACVSAPALAQDATPFTGPYVGGVLGFDSVEQEVAGQKGDDNGTVYGGVIGYDMNLGGVIVGAEAEYTESAVGYSTKDILVEGDEARLNAGRDLYAGARIGYQFDPNAMVYVKGGYTNAKAKLHYDDAELITSYSDELDGFRVGGGLEASAKNMFVRLEYRYSDYGSYSTNGLLPNIDTSRHQGVVMAGLRF